MSQLLTLQPVPSLIKSTRSRCPACLARIPAEVVACGDEVWMIKRCTEHGEFRVRIAANRRFYYDSRGDSSPCCGGGSCAPAATSAGSTSARTDEIERFETLSTCIALVEIVDSCNLTCPTCYSSSPWGIGEEVDCVPFDAVRQRVDSVLNQKGFIDILQLTGGEPTIHPEFFRILEWAITQPKRIGYVLVNTNAVRIATDTVFRERLAEIRRAFGRFELYMQFDGPQLEGQATLRAADLRETRRRAIDEAGALGVPTTLAMVVTPETLPHLGDTFRFGVERPHVRGITFQPMFTSGRVPATSSTLPIAADAPTHITVGDVIIQLVAQSRGVLREADFTPLPCGDPNCHTIGYLLRMPQGPIGLSRLIDLKSVQGFLNNRVDYRIEDLAKCGCDSEPLGQLIKSLEISPSQPFRLFVKPFMDAWTYDEDRIDRCCTHVIRPDGKLDSFCRYYLMGGGPGLGLRAPYGDSRTINAR